MTLSQGLLHTRSYIFDPFFGIPGSIKMIFSQMSVHPMANISFLITLSSIMNTEN